jgi:hypothetical protein
MDWALIKQEHRGSSVKFSKTQHATGLDRGFYSKIIRVHLQTAQPKGYRAPQTARSEPMARIKSRPL